MTLSHPGVLRHSRPLTIALTLGLGALVLPLVAEAATTIRGVMDSPLRMLDPIATTAHITRNHGYMVYDTLLGMDLDHQPRPQMADWAVSDDGMTYTFTLREGLSWHDGAPVTAADCVASIRRWAARDAGGQMLMANVAGLEASDERTITLSLSNPFGYVLELLAKPSGVPAFMMPERIARLPADQVISEAIGSGPFKFVTAQFQPGVRAVYEKFADYVPRAEPPNGTAGGKRVEVDRVEFVTMPDAQTAINALRSGEVDFFEQVPIDLLPLLEGDDQIHTQVLNELGYQSMARMNFLQPPFDDVRLRRAAFTAIGQGDVLAAMVGNPDYYQTCGSVFGCGTPLADEAGSQSLVEGGDPERARQLLEQAGYDGTPVAILQATDLPILLAPPVVVAEQLRKAGFNVQLMPMDWQSIVARRVNQGAVAQGGWNLLFSSWIVQEVWNPINNPMLNGGGPSKAWFGWPEDPQIDHLRAEFAAATDQATQHELASRIQAHAMDYVSYVPLGQYRMVSAWGTQLEGMRPAPAVEFWGVSKRQD